MEGRCTLCESDDVIHIHDIEAYPLFKCKSCGFIFINHKFTKGELKKIYSEEEYHYTFSQAKSNQALRDIVTIKKFIKSGRLLDAGCGAGTLIGVAQKNGFDASGIDISIQAVKICRKRNLKASPGVIEDVNEKYDVITMFDVLEHVQEPRKSAKAAYRCLDNGGIFMVRVPNLKRAVLDSDPYKNDNFSKAHINYFTSSTLSMLLKKSGFRIIKINSGSIVTNLLGRMVSKNIQTDENIIPGGYGDNFEPRITAVFRISDILNRIDVTDCGSSVEAVCQKPQNGK